ncbi:MAG: hypothetical protein Q7T53_02850 [Deltaproteobacteria bacterium]|nr:hypothetical protein [Deltaproteobacteria bacterium]
MDRYSRYLTIIAFCGSILILSIFKLSNQDTYLHLKAGEYIVHSWNIPRTDFFSYTAFGKDWVYHEWLFAALTYSIYSFSSLEFLSIATALLIFTTFILLFKLTLRSGTNPSLAAAIVMAAFLGTRFFFSLRPHQVSYLFIVLFLFILTEYSERRNKGIWLLPFLMVPWANIHAGCIYGLALIGLYITGDTIDRMVRDKGFRWSELLDAQRVLILVLVVSVLASLINPYTYRALTYPWEIMQLNTSQFTISVVEWRPTTLANYPYFFLLSSVLVLIMAINYRDIRAREVLIVLVFGFWGAKVERAVGEFLLVTAPISGRYGQILIDRQIKPLIARFTTGFPMHAKLKKSAWIYNLAFSAGIVYLAIVSIERHGGHQLGVGINEEMVPVQAARFLKEAGISGNMYNSYDYGGYLIWFCYPERLVFVDGRHDVHADYLKDAAYLSYEDLSQQFNINYLVLRNARVPGEIPPNDKWGLVYWGDAGRVYLRRNAGNLGLLNRYEYRLIQPDQEGFGYLNPYIKDSASREELIRELNMSIAFDQNNLNAHVALAYVYKNSGNQYSDAAIREYEKAIEIRPDEAFLHNSLGVMYKKIGKMTDAKKEWEKTIEVDSGYLPAYHNLSEYYSAIGNLNTANRYEDKYKQLKSKKEKERH